MRRRILDQSHRHTLRDSHTDEEIVFHHRNDFGLDRLPTEVLLARNENTSSRASCTACCGLEQPADSDFASELPRMGGALLGTRVGCTCEQRPLRGTDTHATVALTKGHRLPRY
jgi:hypothetical protein